MEPHIHALDTFWLDFFLITSSTVLLPVCVRVWSCLWPILLIIFCIYVDYLALINRAPSSASAAYNMTDLMICEIVSTAPLFGWNRELFDV